MTLSGAGIFDLFLSLSILYLIAPTYLIAFYTLSSFSLELTEIESVLAKKLPLYPLLPATMLGRLAVDKSYKGNGFGELMLLDAMNKSYKVSQEIASIALIVEAIDEQAIRFYQRFGFISFQSSRERLYLPMKTIEKIIKNKNP